ncbi:MAG TPA: RNA polymerase sigma factor, partial [Planctomycetota bacterium]|nr:RNA polymerase sigma factor [Planctomycetota bacterium]
MTSRTVQPCAPTGTTTSGTRKALLESPPFAQDPRLARLLSLYAPAYQLAVRTLGTARDAEDVVQVAYIKALSNMPDDLPDAEVQPWFFRITVNAARDMMRSEMRRKAREADSGGGTNEPAPLPDGVTREMLTDLQASLTELEE